MQISGNTILITGGASGLGKELASQFHALGNNVIIAGRRKDQLDAMVAAHPGMAAYVMDMMDPASITETAASIVQDHPTLNILFNNAGVMIAEDILTQGDDLSDAEATITTNLLGPIRLTAALLPHLQQRPHATIINTTSGLAFVPLVATPTYSATKAGLHFYTVALREQLRDTAIEVIELVPPGVQTDLMPGHAINPQMMPLDDFITETMALFQQQPTPSEICVERVKFLRYAEANGRFDETVKLMHQHD